MPTMPPAIAVPRVATRSFTIEYLCAGGDKGATALDDLAVAVSGLELANLRDSLGALSNGVVVGNTYSELTSINQAAPEVAPLDESFSSASTRAVLVFQNDALELRSISVPAPDESIFGDDGVTINRTNALVAAAIADALVVINGGAAGTGTYAYLRGYRQENSRRLPRSRTRKASIEPGAGVNPPAAPGT